VVHYLASAPWRRLITGFLFGTTGALIALSFMILQFGKYVSASGKNTGSLGTKYKVHPSYFSMSLRCNKGQEAGAKMLALAA
jgi:hypothetical protein